MYKISLYKKSDNMGDLLSDKFRMLFVANIFNIPLGFGDETIEEVCQKSSVDSDAFLLIVNLLLGNDTQLSNLSPRKVLPTLINYLKNSHKFFLDYKLRRIREEIEAIVSCDNNDIARAILDYYNEYEAEVTQHITSEEKQLFPYVESLLENKKGLEYSIDDFSENHENIDEKLTELKGIIIKYYPGELSSRFYKLLMELHSCAEDLNFHTSVENELLSPLASIMEKEV